MYMGSTALFGSIMAILWDETELALATKTINEVQVFSGTIYRMDLKFLQVIYDSFDYDLTQW